MIKKRKKKRNAGKYFCTTFFAFKLQSVEHNNACIVDRPPPIRSGGLHNGLAGVVYFCIFKRLCEAIVYLRRKEKKKWCCKQTFSGDHCFIRRVRFLCGCARASSRSPITMWPRPAPFGFCSVKRLRLAKLGNNRKC